MIIDCPNIKQVIVRTASLQLQNRINKCYYIFDYDIRLWHYKQQNYEYIIDPHLIVFEAIGSDFIMIKAIPEGSNKVFHNSFSESTGSHLRITLL
ncbi:MAG: hypothetical protein VZS44_08650 [Bacilli bacterium]|nr:hypothetical protein [Bacilli bacterium]